MKRMKSFVKGWAIVRVSLLEALGRPIALLLTFASAGWILVLPMLQFQRFSEDGRMARDCGLAMAFLFGLVFVIGSAGRLRESLGNGTAAAVLVKPVSRGFWMVGQCVGGMLAAGLFLAVQVAVVILAEAYSPTYRLDGQYARVGALLWCCGGVLVPLVLGALNQWLRRGRFVLTAVVGMPIVAWLMVLLSGAGHVWGMVSAGLAIGLGLVQIAAVAMAFATRCTAGLTMVLSVVFVLVWMYGLNGAAYLPLDALSMGGAVPVRTLFFLLPQAMAVVAVALWCATGLLRKRAIG